MNDDLPILLEPREVACWLGLPKRKVEDLARTGAIPSVLVLGQIRFDPDALREWLEQRRNEPHEVGLIT